MISRQLRQWLTCTAISTARDTMRASKRRLKRGGLASRVGSVLVSKSEGHVLQAISKLLSPGPPPSSRFSAREGTPDSD